MLGFAKVVFCFLFWIISVRIIYKNFAHFNTYHCITSTIYIYEKLVKVKYRLAETPLRAGFKKSRFKAAERQKTLHQVVQRLNATESLKDCPRSGSSQVIC